jgi:hypothetical protein
MGGVGVMVEHRFTPASSRPIALRNRLRRPVKSASISLLDAGETKIQN